MNFLAHIFLSGDNEAVKFGNFIGDWVKGKSYNNFPQEIQKGILLHRKIDSYTDSHKTVKKSILKIRQAYGKYSGVVTDILYDHFLAQNWQIYSESSLKDYVNEFSKIVFENFDTVPQSAKIFVSPFIRRKRLICYSDINCFAKVLRKMAVYTSMPNKVKEVMRIINENYEDFLSDFTTFFPEIIDYTKIELLNQSMPQSNPKRQSN